MSRDRVFAIVSASGKVVQSTRSLLFGRVPVVQTVKNG
ncbi:hypothetical protein NBRC3293_0517 [Gluconobacter oxydans NBRC 3293]|uniref:Uncharacterized protein n=1 Tax=Gluconobacter oxydans NBRC 3293 TaxID=1315969 RepID=A0A829WT54_GLUOY|nr:hypothetical protein NBRC3293_0517 [Gluconobacter oxydans NBRC 3293]